MHRIIKWTFLSVLLTHLGCDSPPDAKSHMSGFAPLKIGETPHTEGVYDHAEDGSPVLRMIDGAQSSIDIEIYELNDPTVRQALVKAVQRGVPTRIVIEPSPVGVCNSFLPPTSNNSAACQKRREMINELTSAGVKVVPFNKELCGGGVRSCFQHGKLLLVDRKAAMISTGNFNSSSFCNEEGNPSKCNRDYSVVTRDSDVVMALHNIFERDFAAKPYDIDQLLTPGVKAKLSVSPVAEPNLIGLINSAQRTLQIQAQYLKEPEINAAIQQAAQRGVKVEATMASTCAFSRYPKESTKLNLQQFYNPMLQAGVQMRFFTEANRINGKRAYMHAKVFLADDARMWIGSINGSTRSTEANREFGLFLQRGEWIQKIKQILAKDMNSPGNEDFKSNLECIKDRQVDDNEGNMPTHPPSDGDPEDEWEDELEYQAMTM